MEKNFLEFGLSAWWIPVVILVALVLAFLLYQKKGVPWSKNQNLILGSLRFIAIFLILLLLLEPLFRYVFNHIERPLIVIGIDNSSSIASVHQPFSLRALEDQLKELASELEKDKDYRVEIMTLSGKQDSLSFAEPTTDLSLFFREAEDRFFRRNLAMMLVVTDGIYNRGSSPEYRSYGYPVHTLGLGDTIPQRDVVIKEVRTNSVAYNGNEFPINVKVTGEGFVGRPLAVRVSERGKLLKVENTTVADAGNEFTFLITADTSGLKHLTISTTLFEGEVTHVNNRHEVFIEVLESKKQVLIAAQAPHPDIRAIRSVLEETGNYEITVQIVGMKDVVAGKKFDVQILLDGVIGSESSKSGIWTINTSSAGAHFKEVSFIDITSKGPPDQVRPAYNSNFSKFKLSRDISRLTKYPPVMVPFGDYRLSGPYEVLFYQQVGSVLTDKPLIAVFDDGRQRKAISAGQGLWQWRMQEVAQHEEDELFTEIIQKLTQYLSINENKKQFRLTQGLDLFTEGDVIFFEVELYDDIFQQLEAQPYTLEIIGEADNVERFEYVFGSESKVARATIFPPGTYRFKATAQVGDKLLVERGEFMVHAQQLELLELTANHRLLQQVADKSGGQYYHLSQFDQLKADLKDTPFQGIIHSETSKKLVLNILWVLWLICGLLCSEWMLRKYWGGY